MTKDEIKKELKERGIEFDGRWSEDKLKELLPSEPLPKYSEDEVKNILDSIDPKNVKPIEEVLKDAHRHDDGVFRTNSGIIIPDSVLMSKRKTEWEYFTVCSEESTTVLKKMYNGRQEEVRTYSLSVHGDAFNKLADQFCAKMNAV